MEQDNPYGYISEGKIFRNAFLDFPAREIGEVRESEASTIKYFEDRFAMAETKIATLEKAVEESENKGSYLMKLLHMREYLAGFDALGDYPSLFERLDTLEEQLREIIAQNRVKNIEIKRALLAEAAPFEHSTDWKEATDQLIDIKNRWIKTGAVDEQYQEEVEDRFQQLLDNFYQRKKAFFNDRKQLVRDRVYKYRGLIFHARRLQRMEDRREAMEQAIKIQAEWREIGKVPSFKYNQLFQEFRQTVGQIFKPARPSFQSSSFKQRTFQGSDNALEKKKELIEKARRLENDANPSEAIKQLRQEWKNSGMVPREDAYPLNEAFNDACNMANEKSFLNRLVHSKDPDFDTLSQKEQIVQKINVLHNLIDRDERELELFKENMGNFSRSDQPRQAGYRSGTPGGGDSRTGTPGGSDSRSDPSPEQKLKIQERKVAIKRKLLMMLNDQLKSM